MKKITIGPIGLEHSEELSELLLSTKMNPSGSGNVVNGFIKHINSEQCRGLGLFVNGHLVSGGQLTAQKYSHGHEIGLWTHSEYQNNGYGYQVARALIEFGFNSLLAHRIFGKTFINNVAAIKVMEKLNMVKEGELRDVGFKDNNYFNEVYYSILENEFRE
jgi:ribosomal-protein-alanine N-acetyltransferase